MRIRVLFALLAVPCGLLCADGAADAKRAREIFLKAVRAQGRVSRDQIRDVRLEFKGQIRDEGSHHIVRTYWYRSKDRSLRILTRARANGSGSERGVLKDRFWDRRSSGGIIALRGGNMEHRAVIATIEKDRDQFERILRMVLLARLDDGETTFRLVAREPVRLEKDLPFNASQILGKDRTKHAYWVVELERRGGHRLRLFVRTDGFTVRKAVHYAALPPGHAGGSAWVYYFGKFKVDKALGLLVPQLFSAHRGRPTDARTKLSTGKAYGVITVGINAGLKDSDLRPTPGPKSSGDRSDAPARRE